MKLANQVHMQPVVSYITDRLMFQQCVNPAMPKALISISIIDGALFYVTGN